MNAIDLVLIVIILLAVWSGWRKGFITGILELVSWLGSLAVGFYTYGYAAAFLQKLFPGLGIWIQPIGFVGTVLLARVIFAILIARVLYTFSGRVHQHTVNQAMGIIPGFINGIIYAALISALLFVVPFSSTVSATAKASPIANRLVAHVEWANERLSPIFDDAVRRSMNKMTVEPKSDETVNLHFKVTDVKVREDLEAKMLEMVNKEREKVGLKPLKGDPELALVARAHSRDMFARGYFSHYTPEKKSPFDRMKEARVKFLTAGENLALGQTLQICHRGLMNSPGHRANILHPSFGRLGIGILDGGIYGLMVSQEFRN